MYPPIGPALFTLSASLSMALYVLARRYKEPLHWTLLGLLSGLALWTTGVLVRGSATTGEGLIVALKLVFTGVLLSGSFWLLAAALYVRHRALSQPRLAVAVLVVSSLLALALFTNEGHRLFIRKVDFAALEAGPRSFVGPLYWVFLVWVYGCVGVGMALYLRAARTLLRADSRRRALILGLAAAAPLISSTLYVFQLVPVRFDLTPIGLMISIVLLFLAVFRYQLLESLPIARETVVSHLDDGVVMATASGRITDWNPAAERILSESVLRSGAPLAEVLSRLLARAHPGAPQPAGARLRSPAARCASADSVGLLACALATGDAEAGPASIRTPDGRVIEVTMAAVEEGRGEPSGRFALLSDRSEIHRIERLARQSQRLDIVGALAAGVAHEISDPLTFVRANLVEIERLGRRVESEVDGPDADLAALLVDLRSVALETLEGVERMGRIMQDMRELSSVDRQGFASVDLAQVARAALRLARLDGESEGPSVQLSVAALPAVHGNADRLVQVVLNLLVNARQALAGSADARICIEARQRDGEVELAVRDNGPGIPDELRHRVFDPFFTTRGPDEGTGLGLALAFDIAREHDGVLEERPVPGGGACFVLRLPIAGACEPAGRSGTGWQMEVDQQ